MARANPPDSSDPIPHDIFRHVIRRQKTYLIDRLGYYVSTILDKLGEMDVITDDTLIRNIQDTIKNKTRSDGIRVILDDVISQSEENYLKLLDILDEIDIDSDVKERLLEEERKINTKGITKEMNKMTLLDQSPGSHYDICIIFEDTEVAVAEAIKEYLVDLDNDIKVLMFDDETEFEDMSKADKLEKIYRFSSMQFYIIPKYESEDVYVDWIKDSLIMQCVDCGKFNMRKVLQDKHRIPNVKLANIQDIKWYDHHKSNFSNTMRKLIDSLKAKRPS